MDGALVSEFNMVIILLRPSIQEAITMILELINCCFQTAIQHFPENEANSNLLANLPAWRFTSSFS